MSVLADLPKFARWSAALSFCVLFALPVESKADDAFRERVIPFVQKYCVRCHNQKTSEGELDLSRFTSVKMLGEDFRQWEHVITFLQKEEMPPADEKQPSKQLRSEMIKTLQQLLLEESRKLAGDPGVVLPRRLTNAEYNYTIRDLTGVDIRPTDSFPIDPASGEGFNNTGEALTMSPSLFKKYYAAAEQVADHLLLKPSGLAFAPHRVMTFADRMKYYEQAIIRFYETHDVDYEQYLTAAWSYRHRPNESQQQSIEQWAAARNLSPKYLRRLWDTLQSDGRDGFYLDAVKQRWNGIPAPDNADAAARQIKTLAAKLQQMSQLLCTPETRAIVSNAGNAPIQHIERRTKTAGERDTFNEALIAEKQPLHVELRDIQKNGIKLFLRVSVPAGRKEGIVVLKDLNFSKQPPERYRRDDNINNTPLIELLKEHAAEQYEKMNFGKHPHGTEIEADALAVQTPATIAIELPAAALKMARSIHFHVQAVLDREQSEDGIVQVSIFDHQPQAGEESNVQIPVVNPEHAIAQRLRQSGSAFCAVFPNRFVYVDPTRGLSAGFHLIEGVFRDDQSLCKLVLDDAQNQTLNRLWDELMFGSGMTEKMLRGFVFFERSERNFMKHPDFDEIKEEDPRLTDDDTLMRFRDIYLARSHVKQTGKELESHPIYKFFESFRHGLQSRESQFKQAEPIYLKQLEEFARRAYRRPLTTRETEQLHQFYQDISQQPEFGIEQATRASIVRLLVSPHFCYRADPLPDGESTQPLSDIALASRLSYFLWSSMPDEQLLKRAESGTLHDDNALRGELRRMLQSPKVDAIGREFFGQWLGHREFLTEESVNRDVFRDFDDDLKQAMFEEPTRVITDLIQHDRPVTDLLSSDTTIVNRRLARHYGVPFNGDEEEWVSVSGLRDKGRGGLMGMAVFLTNYSQPERTSPVKRGFWVFHKILGRHIPPPPPDVAVLPAKESDTGGKTIRELLKLHTDDVKCARCHVRFDPFGLSMEGFDPIGRSRSKDLAGRSIDNIVALPSGKEARGVPEFARYIAAERRDEFTETLCRKFLGYALGRSLLLSDQPLLERMQTTLQENEFRLGPLFEVVVLSPQFRTQRCRDFTAASFQSQRQGN